jgi:hypothetical protein
MTVILNIGLDVNATRSLSAHVVKEILAANDILIHSATLLDSDTEPTLVVETRPRIGLRGAIMQTAIDLQQDCIAAYAPNGKQGALFGPRCEAWGAFNPEFFFLPNGQRLASNVATA